MKKFLADKRNQVILLLSLLFLIRAPQEGMRFTVWVLAGVAIASIADILIKRVFFQIKLAPKSAIISGFITAGILDYHQAWFFLVIFSALAVASKHIVRYKGQHIFNPANFALFVAVLFHLPLTWKIESNIYLIIAFGIYIAYVLKRLPHVLGFLVFFSLLFATQQINPLSFISWFFVFIMLIEPKTSGSGALKGFTFGATAGIVSFLVFKFLPGYDIFVMSLFVANVFNPIFKKFGKITSS